MKTYVIIGLTVTAVVILAAGLIRFKKLPKMPAFYKRLVREGFFNRLMFWNYDVRKTVYDGIQFPETEIEEICGKVEIDSKEMDRPIHKIIKTEGHRR